MNTHFAEVLARETARLDRVADKAALEQWRRDVIRELVTPNSPYALAMCATSDLCRQADFLDRWRELIAATLHRLLRCDAGSDAPRAVAAAPIADVDLDAQKSAVLIVAALKGGSMLSRITGDRRSLDSALDLAFMPLTDPLAESPEGRESPSR